MIGVRQTQCAPLPLVGRGWGWGSVFAARLSLVSRTREEVDAAATAIRVRGEAAEALVLDVTDVAAVREAVAAAEPYDIVINNAGTNRPAPFAEVSVEDFDAIFRSTCARRISSRKRRRAA